MTDQPALDLDAIAARAAHLHEYALLDDKPLQQEADQLTGTDVPALIAALAHAERIRENADFHLGQEMARRQLAEKAVLEAQQERDKLIRWHREDEMTREVLLAEIRHLRAWITKLETYAHGCDAEGCVIPHSSWCEDAKKTAAANNGCTCGQPWTGHPQPHAMHCWTVNPPRAEVEEMRREIVRLQAERDTAVESHVVADDSSDPEHTDDCPGCTRSCGHDDYHDPHEWADRPGVWCPGIGYDDEETAR